MIKGILIGKKMIYTILTQGTRYGGPMVFISIPGYVAEQNVSMNMELDQAEVFNINIM